ncbi:40S ribosomal protein S4-3 [Zea mays]|uniref:40S ribosomal protein S4-3 n=1 Tax=Zea mays TaxID=4577 RepID=A0A1D6KCK5_MAIZE|nr:40S ribosomal protein S4-3 [Zea mays]
MDEDVIVKAVDCSNQSEVHMLMHATKVHYQCPKRVKYPIYDQTVYLNDYHKKMLKDQYGIPYLNTYDGRTIRYPDPLIKANDTIKIDLETNKIMDFIKFDVGNMVTGGRNTRRVGVIKHREKHKGSFETIHVLLGAFCYV